MVWLKAKGITCEPRRATSAWRSGDAGDANAGPERHAAMPSTDKSLNDLSMEFKIPSCINKCLFNASTTGQRLFAGRIPFRPRPRAVRANLTIDKHYHLN
ncbi:hypothetical protein [Azotobacter chroococcum]|uniref:hypothetical protein n=1 Tax=Azotobacter chroococcum TaxID=353 RepID=UPI001EF03ABD|nr:hypothetical protein [Azotobacter chroococcum]